MQEIKLNEWLPGDILAPRDSRSDYHRNKTILLLKLKAKSISLFQVWEVSSIRDGELYEETLLLDSPKESGYVLVARAVEALGLA